MQVFQNKDIEKKLDRFKALCKDHGIKLTPQRLLIYEKLIDSDVHPSTDMLYQKVKETFPTVSFDTVNRTLLTFYEIGVAGLVEGTGNPKRFDGNLEKHHHFQCVQCKKIVDIYSDVYDHIPVPPEIQNTFTILNKIVHLEGICTECRQIE
jgi:Fur family transcriptional regulator, peroxide stress response regulator